MSKGEAPMGRPIQDKWFGQAAAPGGQIKVTGAKFADATTAVDAYILSQTGDTAYMVQDSAKTHAPEILFMVNANALTALLPGQCYINATPFGGTALPAKKIAQYRITLFTVPYAGTGRATGSPVADPVAEYTWSTQPATKRGQVNLITESSTTGIVNAVAMGVAGAGYFVAPAVTFPSPGVGATGRATISATGTVTGVTVLTGGYGYVAGAATIAPPPASVTATAVATVTGGIITGITVVNGGGFYLTAPGVTVTPVSGGTAGAATALISAGKVTGFTITNGGTGYTVAPTITLGAPPAATTATATFTVTTVAGPFMADEGREGEEGEGGEEDAGATPEAASAPATATAIVTVAAGRVAAINITNGGTGYTTAPAVTISGDGAGAEATATVVDGAVTEFTIIAGGDRYTTATVTIAAPPASRSAPSGALAESQANTAQQAFRARELREQAKTPPFRGR